MWQVRLADPDRAAARAGAPALERRALVHVRGRDDEVVADEVVVGLGVRDRGAQHLLDLARGRARREREHRPRLGDGPAADVLGDEPRLARRHPHPLGHGAHLLRARRSPSGPLHLRLAVAGVRAERPRRRELAELVPDHLLGDEDGHVLAPVVDRDRVADHLREDVEVRDQVRIICFSPDSFIAWIRLSSRSSTNGPFLLDLDT